MIVTGTLAFAPVVANALAEHLDAIDEGKKDDFEEEKRQFLVEKQDDLGHVVWDQE